MSKQLIDYINGETNVVRDEFILSREKNKNGELIFVNAPDTETPMYVLWNSNKLAKKYKIKEQDGECIIEKVKPKGTGGKPAYLMLFQGSLDKVEELSAEAAGLLLKLLPCVEWNTCRLIQKKDKKSLTRQLMSEKFSIGILKLKKQLSELTNKGFIEYRNKAYYLNEAFVRKGGSHEN